MLLVLAILTTVAGCDWVTKDRPEKVRVQLEGKASAEVQLVTSTAFVARQAMDGSMDVQFVEADTTVVSPPFNQTYDISIDRRFVARVLRTEPESDELVLKGWVDGRQRFNRPGRPVPEDSLLQFVYVFQSNQLPGDGNL
jgi:hypothetical protein